MDAEALRKIMGTPEPVAAPTDYRLVVAERAKQRERELAQVALGKLEAINLEGTVCLDVMLGLWLHTGRCCTIERLAIDVDIPVPTLRRYCTGLAFRGYVKTFRKSGGEFVQALTNANGTPIAQIRGEAIPSLEQLRRDYCA